MPKSKKWQKTAKIVFLPAQDDIINRSRRNFAGKRVPWVCYSSPNLALIGKRGSVQKPPKMSKFAKIVFICHRKPTQRTHSDEIWPVSEDRAPNLALIVKRGSVREAPKMLKFAQNCGFWPPEADTTNTFRWNLACKCRPWVCSITPNLAIIGKRGSV